MRVAAMALLLCSCQLVGGYEDFDAAATTSTGEVEPQLPCDVLPETKTSDATGILVRIEQLDGACSWMDATEVTVAAYGAWLASPSSEVDWTNSTLGDGGCLWKVGRPSDPAGDADDPCRLVVEALEPPQGTAFAPDKPIRCVDWCEATAFCAAAGMRLCNGDNPSHQLVPLGKPDEWGLACTLRGTRVYPYGNVYEREVCNDDQALSGCAPIGISTLCGPTPVDRYGECRASPTTAIHLSGNVAEWINLCSDDPSATSSCQQRGGSYADAPEDVTCTTLPARPRGERSATVGFRCCDDLTAKELRDTQASR